MAKRHFCILTLWGLTFFLPVAAAMGEIQIDSLAVQEYPPHHYDVSAMMNNKTAETREVVLRAQLFFFEQAAPPGDLPVMILRKDETVVLKAGKRRSITVKLIHEGKLPKGSLRMEPEIRIRRQRVWNY